MDIGEGEGGPLGPKELAFKARALAQAHPLTPLAKRYVEKVVGEQRTSQPLPEIGIWAGAAVINGYCLRRVEEEDVGFTLAPADAEPVDLAGLEDEAASIAADLRSGQPGAHALTRTDGGPQPDEGRAVAALDLIIGSEVGRRLDHWRDDVDETAWAELEEYLTWWVVKGYALRVAEMATGAVLHVPS